MITVSEKNLLNAHNSFRLNIDKYIEGFVLLYGENRRQEIIDKFNKTILIGYRSPSDLNTFVSNLNSRESDLLQVELLEKCGFEVPDISERQGLFNDNIVSRFFGDTIDNGKYRNLNYYKEYVDNVKIPDEKYVDDFKKSGFEFYKRYADKKITYEDYEKIFDNGIDGYIPTKKPLIDDTMTYYLNKENSLREKDRLRENVVEFLSGVGYEVTVDNIDELYFKDTFYKVEKVINGIDEMRKKYQETYDILKPYMDYYKEYEEIEEKVRERKDLEFIKKIVPYLPDNEKELVLKDIEKDGKINNNMSIKHLYAYFGSYFHYSFPDIEVFTSQSEDILNDPNESEWKKDNIKKTRIKYFKNLGIDLGDNYDDYVDSLETISEWPSTELAEELLNLYIDNLNECNKEVFETLSFNKKIFEEIKESGLLDNDPSFSYDIYDQPITCVNPNIRMGENGLELKPLVLINMRSDDALDHLIVHELNHVLELSLVDTSSREYNAICGWDLLNCEYNQEQNSEPVNNENRIRRDYELFNEIINEILAQLISEKMEQNNIYIFNSRENHSYRNATSYEYTFFIVRDFIMEFLDDIVASRQNGNIEIIYNKVGKENFDDLNELFNIFNSKFSGFKIYQVLSSIKNGIDNEDTRVYREIENKRDEILNRMREYALSSKEVKAL